MALKTYLYRSEGVTAAELQPLLPIGAAPVVGSTLGPSLVPVTVDETLKEDLDDAMESLGYEYDSEYTGPPLQGRQDYGVLATDPTSPVPNAGDYYYNSASRQELIYSGTSWDPVQKFFSGAGSPQHTVDAPLGSEYLQTDLGPGAGIVWLKTTASGLTGGWIVQ